jgi:4-amino-4-deoxy-L-arabinose transferase-like glycosyltransferase
MHAEGRRLERVALIVAILSLCSVHAPLIGYRSFANVDEAYAGAIGERLLEGFKLYDGAVSQRGPLMYYTFAALDWLHGWDNIVALRLWALGLCLAHLLLVRAIARRCLSREASIVATLVSGYGLVFGFPAYDGYALHGETLQLPALLVASWLGVVAVRGRSRRARAVLLAAGLAYGAAACVKQSVLLHPAALVVWLVVDASRRRAPLREILADVAVLAGAVAVLPLAFILHAWHEGTLRELVYYCFTYNRDVHMHPAPSQRYPWLPNLFFRLGDCTSFFLLTALLVAFGAPWVVRRARAAWAERSLRPLGRGFGVAHFFGLNFAIALVSASTLYRFFPHYFLQALPFAALSAGAALAPAMRSRRWGARVRSVAWSFTGFVLFCGWLGTVFGEKVDGRVMHDRTVNDVAKWIAAITRPDDRIFVWGFSSWIYQYAHRRPAGRYMFETYVTGVVPWFWEKRSVEAARVVPGSVAALLGDLEREKPAVVVDAGSVMLARSIRTYPPFADWLHAHYCFELRLGAYDVYRRKAERECAVAYFPRPFQPVDWAGRGLGIPLPVLADEELTRPLPTGNYFKPIWFKHEPRPEGVDAIVDARMEKEEAEAKADGFRIEPLDVDDAKW